MHDTNFARHTVDASAVPTRSLLKNIGKDLKTLAELEVRLAQAEAKADVEAELQAAKLGAIAIVCGLLGLNLLAVAIVLLFAPEVAWLAAMVMGVLFLAGAAAAALRCNGKLHKNPLAQSREALKEDLAWIKTHLR